VRSAGNFVQTRTDPSRDPRRKRMSTCPRRADVKCNHAGRATGGR
jgi:hypothetical protein